MKFSEFLVEKVDELLHLTFLNGVDYTVTLRLLGKDGMNRRVYVARCLIKDKNDAEFENDTYAAMIFRDDGSLLADAHFGTQDAAVKLAGEAIAKQQKGYGPDHRKGKMGWQVYNTSQVEVDGWR